MNTLQNMVLILSRYCYENGIHVYDKKEEFIGTSVLNVWVERRDRTDEEIDYLIRQLKVIFILITPIEDIRIKYKVVE